MKNLIYFFICFILFVSCNEQPEKSENPNSESAIKPKFEPQQNTANYKTQLFLVDSLNPKAGFGYNVLVDGKIFVHQPSIPSIPGNQTFSSKEKAELVANLVMLKLKNNIMPPSVSKNELDSLQIFK